MAAPGPPGGLAALVDFVEVENFGAVPDLYGWAGIEGDIGDFRSVRGLIHRALGNPNNIGDLHLSPSLISRTSSGIYECPHSVQTPQSVP